MKHSKYLRLPQYEAKGYPENDIEKIQRLFCEAFGGRRISGEMLKWQMDDNPCLKRRAVSLWDGETMAAYTALTPAKAIYEGREIYTAVSGTTMADERYLGVSVQLFSECRKQNQDIEVIIGFPNQNSYSVAKYLQEKPIGEVAFWTCPAKSRKVAADVRKLHFFSKKHGELFRFVAGRHQYIKVRDQDYLNWRFIKKPEYDYLACELIRDGELCGYIVTDIYIENGIRQLQIVDLIAKDDNSMSALLGYSVNLGYEQNCSIIKAWMTSKYYEKIFRDAGFTYGDHPFVMMVWNKKLVIDESYLTMCDSDIF